MTVSDGEIDGTDDERQSNRERGSESDEEIQQLRGQLLKTRELRKHEKVTVTLRKDPNSFSAKGTSTAFQKRTVDIKRQLFDEDLEVTEDHERAIKIQPPQSHDSRSSSRHHHKKRKKEKKKDHSRDRSHHREKHSKTSKSDYREPSAHGYEGGRSVVTAPVAEVDRDVEKRAAEGWKSWKESLSRPDDCRKTGLYDHGRRNQDDSLGGQDRRYRGYDAQENRSMRFSNRGRYDDYGRGVHGRLGHADRSSEKHSSRHRSRSPSYQKRSLERKRWLPPLTREKQLSSSVVQVSKSASTVELRSTTHKKEKDGDSQKDETSPATSLPPRDGVSERRGDETLDFEEGPASDDAALDVDQQKSSESSESDEDMETGAPEEEQSSENEKRESVAEEEDEGGSAGKGAESSKSFSSDDDDGPSGSGGSSANSDASDAAEKEHVKSSEESASSDEQSDELTRRKRKHKKTSGQKLNRAADAYYSKFASSSESEEDDENERPGRAREQHAKQDAEESSPVTSPAPVSEGTSASPSARDEVVSEADDMEFAHLPIYYPAVSGCRTVEEFHCLNRIEEGTYGVVFRAKDKRTDEIVALKRLKMEKEKEDFPITALREIITLLKAQHPNVVTVREIVVGSNMDKIYVVMDFIEHDLKSLMERMKQPFLIGEVKTLMRQMLAGVHHLHDNWILHRDLKASNLLLSHKGILKIGDFGLAREYGSPLKSYTPVVVTLWYRSPELLLGTSQYSYPIDMWSVGCIFAELLNLKPLFPGKTEIDELTRIYKDLGTPSDKIWPDYSELPGVKRFTLPQVSYNQLRKRFGPELSNHGFELLNAFLTYCPSKRITALEALRHCWFEEAPAPVHPDMFPTWPAKSEQGKLPRTATEKTPPPPPGRRGEVEDDDEKSLMKGLGANPPVGGFRLKGDWHLKF